MSDKLAPVQSDSGVVTGWSFWCLGCGCRHEFKTVSDGDEPTWKFNWDLAHPTFIPSLIVERPDGGRCHLLMSRGKIHYFVASTHELRGRIVDLGPEPEPDA